MEAPELDTPGPLAKLPDRCQFCLTPAIQIPLKTCAKCRDAFYCVSSCVNDAGGDQHRRSDPEQGLPDERLGKTPPSM